MLAKKSLEQKKENGLKYKQELQNTYKKLHHF